MSEKKVAYFLFSLYMHWPLSLFWY